MRIAHLSQSDAGGGAAIATYRLHRSLIKDGFDSRMLVLRKRTDDPTVAIVTGNRSRELSEAGARLIERAPLQFYRRRSDALWSPGWFGWPGVHRHPLINAADVVGLYWVTGGLLSLRQISRLLRLGKPVVWRLSDMWPFTGGCHYAGECRGFEDACGRCPQLGSRRVADLSRYGALRRRRWSGEHLTVVAPTGWIAGLARNSAPFRKVRIEIIPTAVALDVYRPLPKPLARQVLRLPAAGRLILFGAAGGATDPRKGSDLLMQALAMLRRAFGPDALELVTFGGGAGFDQVLGFRTHRLGVLHDDLTRVLAYSACDLFVAPSREDNLPNTVVEALACGTPVIACAIGGIPEAVQDGINGHLARGQDAAELTRAIRAAIETPEHLQRLTVGARQTAELRHDADKAATQYISLYQELVERSPASALSVLEHDDEG